MIASDVTSDAFRAALAYPAGGDGFALTGPAGSGKTSALIERIATICAAFPGTTMLISAPTPAAVRRLRERLDARALDLATYSLERLALETVRHARRAEGARLPLDLVDDVTAAGLFEDACASLFSMEWPELAAAQIDPEITGLRSPQRFAASAFRLIRKLRAALVSPDDFRKLGLRGATEFYGRPPNFANSDLIVATAQKYRDSLRVSQDELDRQRTREIDLVLILARLYGLYEASLAERGALTASDAVYEATVLLQARAELRARLQTRFAYAAIDEAQDLTGAQLALLQALFGADLAGVTLAGDASSATRGFSAGARGAAVFKAAKAGVVFSENLRSARAIEQTAKAGADPMHVDVTGAVRGEAVSIYRAEDSRDETRFIVAEIKRLAAAGVPYASIAVVTRHLGCGHAYVDALLAGGVPVDVGGGVDLYEFPAVLDTLAAMWAAVDPFRHDYLMRNLEAPWLRLSDASIAILCGEARDPQPLLFTLPGDEEDEARAGRWDRKRDLRLGRNVTRGDVDADLSPEARERIGVFRAARERWAGLARTLGPSTLARTIATETVLATPAPGARGRFDAGLIARLLERVERFERHAPLASLHDFLASVDRESRLEADPEPLAVRDPDAVAVLDVEAAKGSEFDAVFVPDLRAGAWPRYYVPDAFLFAPNVGMIAKENVGDASSGRTAKFTYALFRYKYREKYNEEERRAFYVAATRARRRLYLSAPARATRGLNTPEILAELEKR